MKVEMACAVGKHRGAGIEGGSHNLRWSNVILRAVKLGWL